MYSLLYTLYIISTHTICTRFLFSPVPSRQIVPNQLSHFNGHTAKLCFLCTACFSFCGPREVSGPRQLFTYSFQRISK